MEKQKKKKSKVHGIDPIADAVTSLREAEKNRAETAARSEEKEKKKLKMEEERYNLDRERYASALSVEERRVKLEEERFIAEREREHVLQKERKLNLELQAKLLSLLQKLTK